MLAKTMITGNNITPLRTSDTGMTAIGLMDEYKVSHLPIVNDLELLGVISETDIFSMNNFDEAVGSCPLSVTGAYVSEGEHIYEVIRTFGEHRLTLLPVVNDKNHYMGVITLATLAQNIALITASDNPGGIIVLEVNEKDYSLSEIAMIVESNDAKVLSLYLHSVPDSTKLEITLKLNRIDIGPVLQTFNRYNYIVMASFSDQDVYKESLQDRFDSLMNYLNI
jgi:acetoin utilization protein AcuB